eukprot:TRINITY_DN4695_c0_g1_i3.p1 TRINITY_DN4695_c0_g1~~TRINITY_DN4695_c0_g1_i3.p1  ORF type:complete len:755 (-),score=227.30 TRINITY_DN4695_c0_g1_i3:1717-3981(-)
MNPLTRLKKFTESIDSPEEFKAQLVDLFDDLDSAVVVKKLIDNGLAMEIHRAWGSVGHHLKDMMEKSRKVWVPLAVQFFDLTHKLIQSSNGKDVANEIFPIIVKTAAFTTFRGSYDKYDSVRRSSAACFHAVCHFCDDDIRARTVNSVGLVHQLFPKMLAICRSNNLDITFRINMGGLVRLFSRALSKTPNGTKFLTQQLSDRDSNPNARMFDKIRKIGKIESNSQRKALMEMLQEGISQKLMCANIYFPDHEESLGKVETVVAGSNAITFFVWNDPQNFHAFDSIIIPYECIVNSTIVRRARSVKMTLNPAGVCGWALKEKINQLHLVEKDRSVELRLQLATSEALEELLDRLRGFNVSLYEQSHQMSQETIPRSRKLSTTAPLYTHAPTGSAEASFQDTSPNKQVEDAQADSEEELLVSSPLDEEVQKEIQRTVNEKMESDLQKELIQEDSSEEDDNMFTPSSSEEAGTTNAAEFEEIVEAANIPSSEDMIVKENEMMEETMQAEMAKDDKSDEEEDIVQTEEVEQEAAEKDDAELEKKVPSGPKTPKTPLKALVKPKQSGKKRRVMARTVKKKAADKNHVESENEDESEEEKDFPVGCSVFYHRGRSVYTAVVLGCNSDGTLHLSYETKNGKDSEVKKAPRDKCERSDDEFVTKPRIPVKNLKKVLTPLSKKQKAKMTKVKKAVVAESSDEEVETEHEEDMDIDESKQSDSSSVHWGKPQIELEEQSQQERTHKRISPERSLTRTEASVSL